MANISDLMGGEDRQILSTGNTELDKKIADGLPLESLTLIEGENDTGKSVLTQQIIWGAMKQGFSVDLFTTESTTKSFLKQMESMSLDISEYFAWGYIKVFPLHVVGFEWKKEDMVGILAHLITHIQQSKAQVIIIDSLTLFTEYAETDAILTFFTSCKSLVDHGKTILVTLHTYAFEEDTLVRIRSISDAHLNMKKALVGDKYVMVMEVNKVRGARKTTGNLVSFEVHPGYGMKVIPMSLRGSDMGSPSIAVNLPYKPEIIDSDVDFYNDIESSPLYKMLPANAKEYVKASPHLLEYLHTFPVNTYGIPLFLSELKKDLRKMESPNIIYPVNETTFIHILPDPDDVRNYYIPIEPSFLHNVSQMLPAIETRLVDMIDGLEEDPISDKERAEVIKRMLALVTVIRPKGMTISQLSGGGLQQQDMKSKITNFLKTDFTAKDKMKNVKKKHQVPTTPDGKVILTEQEYRAIEYLLIRDKIDMGVLKPFLSDNYIEDISCDGIGPIFIEHKIFKGLKSVIEFKVSSELDEFVVKMAEKIKRPITYRSPIVDATLPDGSRINIVYGTAISRHGSNFSIRKVNEVPLSILNIIESNGLDYLSAAYLWICAEYGMSLFVSGETASGKTTLLNAITAFIPPENKIITIEDTPELMVPHRNWIREVALAKGKGSGGGTGGEVTMFDLLKAALRQRPNQILVGEIRGEEGAVAFGAMQTGHPVMSTFHAASVEKLIQRLCGDPINIPRTYVDNLNLVVIQSAVKRPDGSLVRRMISCNELVGFNPETQGFTFVEMFSWEPVSDTFTWSGKGSSFLLENKIATMLGMPDSKKSEIYLEVEKRAKILERLHKAGYTKFWDLFHMMTKIKKQGLLQIGS